MSHTKTQQILYCTPFFKVSAKFFLIVESLSLVIFENIPKFIKYSVVNEAQTTSMKKKRRIFEWTGLMCHACT